MRRNIVRIDEDKCDGCGLCATACAEGAIAIVEGKARLVSESYCDGLGACLGECPRGAITIEEREADAFDAEAVAARTGHAGEAPSPPAGGCPGAMARRLRTGTGEPSTPASAADGGEAESALGNWPVQLALLPVAAPYLDGADLLLAADCVGFALPGLHRRLLGGKVVAVACPKLDDASAHAEKLAAILAARSVRSLTVVRMEVPCCTGIVRAAEAALAEAGSDLPLREIVVGIDGRIQSDAEIAPAERGA